MHTNRTIFTLLLVAMFAGNLVASDWPSWRGSHQTGVSDDSGLIADWSLDGKNVIWKNDFTGRSTPIIMNGRVFVAGRSGAGQSMQRALACYDAENGDLIWEKKFNVYHTTVPFTRLGWSSITGDPETGNIYFFGVDGRFTCLNKDGDVLWEHSFPEEYNRFSGYGGRTCTPVIDEDLVIVNGANNTWGEHLIMKHRFFAYDKSSGELVWISTIPEGNKNTNYSVPVVAIINGVRQLIVGTGTGWVYGMQARTGKHIWKFQLSKGGIQSSVVVDGKYVFATHHVENLDNTVWGRVACIDATGAGDVTKTHEVWRHDGLEVGYASPLIYDGRLYLVNNSANLYALDAKNGEMKWELSIGKVGKGSPVWADGKIFATEVNGGFHIIEPGEKEAKFLDRKEIPFDGKRFSEIFGSPAIAYGRVYFTSETGLYCLGKKDAVFKATKASPIILKGEKEVEKSVAPAHIQIVPAEIWADAGEKVKFKVRAFDKSGRRLNNPKTKYSMGDLTGRINKKGKAKFSGKAANRAGYVVAKVGELESKARVQVAAKLPWSFDFEDGVVDKNPPMWPGTWKFFIKNIDGDKVLLKPPSKKNLKRHNLYLGPPEMSGYTIQADVKGQKVKRRSPDMGIICQRYYFDFMTKKKKLQIRVWPAELERLKEEVAFEWDPGLWYTMKMRVDIIDGQGHVKGKIWPRNQKEPTEWTITAIDPMPNTQGSPGLYGDAPTNIYFDNVKIDGRK